MLCNSHLCVWFLRDKTPAAVLEGIYVCVVVPAHLYMYSVKDKRLISIFRWVEESNLALTSNSNDKIIFYIVQVSTSRMAS